MGPYKKFSKLLLSFMIWMVWVQYVYCQTTDSSLGLTGTTFSELSTFITSTTVSSNSTSQSSTTSSSTSTQIFASTTTAFQVPTVTSGANETPYTNLTPAEKGGIGAGVGIGGILVLTGLFYLCKKPRQLSSMSQDRPDTTAPEIVEVNKQN